MTPSIKPSLKPHVGRFLFLLIGIGTPFTASAAPDWDKIQEVKAEMLSQAAVHAIEQQKLTQADPIEIPIEGFTRISGEITPEIRADGSVEVTVSAPPSGESASSIRIPLPKPLDMLSGHSGLAMTVRTDDGTSPEVRWGVRLIGSNGEVAEIEPVIPLLSHWGENEHAIYFDWAFINYGKIEPALDVLKSVKALEFTAAASQRSPLYGPSDASQSAQFQLSGLKLVDYIYGSYDPDRHSWGWDGKDKKDLTLQHRVLEVSGIVARFGGDAGIESAVKALDMAARTQCWDGSFLDRRRGPHTVVSGEYTHGFTLWGLMDAYDYFEQIDLPQLDAPLRIGAQTKPRRAWYQDMIYRGAMSRASALPSEFRDDIIHSNTLVFGANRVLGYAIAMRRAADLVGNAKREAEILEHYQPIIDEIAAEQGAYSGGFPILGEGDRYNGKGIHYDAGYTRTHMDWLVLGIKATGDPVLVKMLDRYQVAIEAAMDSKGEGILPLISERGKGSSPVRLVIPDATAQVGLEYNLPVMAQWGYNVGIPSWAKWEPGARVNHFTNRAHARGYSLGAHSSILLFDLDVDPLPHDIGYRFPRQFPIWSARFYQKDGTRTRTSKVRIDPDGTMHNDFEIQVGEYLETIGVPVWIKDPNQSLTVEALELNGWPTLLEDGAPLHIEVAGVEIETRVNQPTPIQTTEVQTFEVIIHGPETVLPEAAGGKFIPFLAKLAITPSAPNSEFSLTVRNDTPEYSHLTGK